MGQTASDPNHNGSDATGETLIPEDNDEEDHEEEGDEPENFSSSFESFHSQGSEFSNSAEAGRLLSQGSAKQTKTTSSTLLLPQNDLNDIPVDDDGYRWRKYGRKKVKGSVHLRNYYKCTHPNCFVKKQVETNLNSEGKVTIQTTYKGTHTHEPPLVTRVNAHDQLSFKSKVLSEFLGQTEVLIKSEMNNVRAAASQQNNTNDTPIDANGVTQSQNPSTQAHSNTTAQPAQATSLSQEANSKHHASPKLVVETNLDVDHLDDGYHWRKYGQKKVKGSPNPRSYYKCTEPECPVKKQVELNGNIVVNTYEGTHNHLAPGLENGGQLSLIDSSLLSPLARKRRRRNRTIPNSNPNLSVPPLQSSTSPFNTPSSSAPKPSFANSSQSPMQSGSVSQFSPHALTNIPSDGSLQAIHLDEKGSKKRGFQNQNVQSDEDEDDTDDDDPVGEHNRGNIISHAHNSFTDSAPFSLNLPQSLSNFPLSSLSSFAFSSSIPHNLLRQTQFNTNPPSPLTSRSPLQNFSSSNPILMPTTLSSSTVSSLSPTLIPSFTHTSPMPSFTTLSSRPANTTSLPLPFLLSVNNLSNPSSNSNTNNGNPFHGGGGGGAAGGGQLWDSCPSNSSTSSSSNHYPPPHPTGSVILQNSTSSSSSSSDLRRD